MAAEYSPRRSAALSEENARAESSRENRTLRTALTRKQNEFDIEKQNHQQLAEDHKRLVEVNRVIEKAAAIRGKETGAVEEAINARQLQAEKDLRDAASKEQRIRNRLLDSQQEHNETKAMVDRLKARLSGSQQQGMQDSQKKDIYISKMEKKLKAAEIRDAASVQEMKAKEREGLQMKEALMEEIRDMEVSYQGTIEDLQRAVSEVKAEGKKHESHYQILREERKEADARESDFQTRLQEKNDQLKSHETLAVVQGQEIERLEIQIRLGSRSKDKLQRLVHEKEQAVAEALSLHRNLETALYLKERDLEVINQNSLGAKERYQEALEKALLEAEQSHQTKLKEVIEASNKAVENAREEQKMMQARLESENAATQAGLRDELTKIRASLDGNKSRSKDLYEALQKQTNEHIKLQEKHANLKASLPDLSFGVALYR